MATPGSLTAPFLKRVTLLDEKADRAAFPFTALAFLRAADFALEFPRPITFLVGDNGSGKSTLIEALAAVCGFPAAGGSQQHRLLPERERASALAEALRPAWLPKVSEGFFFRAESFFEVAHYIDVEGSKRRVYGGRELLGQSHGESFLSFFTGEPFERMPRRLFLMDEPETALSPSNQLAFLALLRAWEEAGNTQAIIATHSPILLSYPGATLYALDGERIAETTVEETEHYRITRAFLADPHRYLRQVFEDR